MERAEQSSYEVIDIFMVRKSRLVLTIANPVNFTQCVANYLHESGKKESYKRVHSVRVQENDNACARENARVAGPIEVPHKFCSEQLKLGRLCIASTHGKARPRKTLRAVKCHNTAEAFHI